LNRPIWLVEAASRTIALPPTMPSHRRIASQSVGVVDLFISGKTTEHRLTQHADKIVPTILVGTAINQRLPRNAHEAKRVIEFTTGQQSGIGGNAETVKLQLKAAVEIKSHGIRFGFTRWLRHQRPRSNETIAQMDSARSSSMVHGKCGFRWPSYGSFEEGQSANY